MKTLCLGREKKNEILKPHFCGPCFLWDKRAEFHVFAHFALSLTRLKQLSATFLSGSYQRYCGFKNPLSAADMVYCITALAEHKDSEGGTADQVRLLMLGKLMSSA